MPHRSRNLPTSTTSRLLLSLVLLFLPSTAGLVAAPAARATTSGAMAASISCRSSSERPACVGTFVGFGSEKVLNTARRSLQGQNNPGKVPRNVCTEKVRQELHLAMSFAVPLAGATPHNNGQFEITRLGGLPRDSVANLHYHRRPDKQPTTRQLVKGSTAQHGLIHHVPHRYAYFATPSLMSLFFLW